MINIVAFLAFAVVLALSNNALSLTYYTNYDIYFPGAGEVVAPEARIIMGKSGGGRAIITEAENEYLLNYVILTNQFGETIPLVATLGGLRPENPLTEGRYTVRFFHNVANFQLLKFTVSENVPVSMLTEPEDFHWNLKIFERRLGYVYNTCFQYFSRECNQYFVTARFKAQPLSPQQTFVYYQVGFIPRFGPHSRTTPFESVPYDIRGLTQTEGAPEFSERWGMVKLIDQCMGLMVYDGYGQRQGPIYSCRPRKYIKGSIAELVEGKARIEDWDKIRDWTYYDD